MSIEMRRLLSLIVVGAIVLYGLGVWLFLLRQDDSLPNRIAGAVVVLAGSRARLAVALDLMDGNAAGTLVVSEESEANDPARYQLCHGAKPTAYKLICRRADPYSTRGEARFVSQLAAVNRWPSLIVVSSRYHLLRARELFARCTRARLIMRGTDADAWWSKAIAVPLEWVKLARAEIFARGC